MKQIDYVKPVLKHELPDPKLHKTISIVKSLVRIIGFGFLPFSISLSAAVLVVAELIGIVEELV